MNRKKTLLMSILLVLVIGLIITGSSFAYFQWSLGYASGTGVNVTIEHGGVTMHIESEAKEFVGLYPTKIDDATDCERARYNDALVTIVNKTGTMAIPSFKLKVKVTKGGSNALTKDALSHIRYTVVPINTTVDASGNPVKGTEVSNCSAGVTGASATGNKYDVETSWSTFGMKFESVSTAGAWSHIPATNDYISGTGGDNKINSAYLPRQYNTNTGNIEGITFKAPQYATTYQYFRVYVWIDHEYTTTTIGTTVSDPLQNAKIEVTWSENSMVEQVVGSGTASDYENSVPIGDDGEVATPAGLYATNGNFTSWDDLVTNGDITLNANKTIITDSNRELVGELVIPEGIIEIGSSAFGWSEISSQLSVVVLPTSVKRIGAAAFDESLISVTIPDGSMLEYIGDYAFGKNYMSSIVIPSGVTTIGSGAFFDCSYLDTIYFEGTVSQWNAINKGEDWNFGVPATKVICSDGEVSFN